MLAAIGVREDPCDAFISNHFASLGELPAGAVVGTSSLRREAQLRARYRHLKVAPLRGNVITRLAKLDQGEYQGIILAAAGLKRLGLGDRIRTLIDVSQSLPAPGQGALAIECRDDRADLVDLLAPLHDAATAACVRAERGLSRALSGSCQLPLAAYATSDAGQVWLRGLVATPDGQRVIRDELRGAAADPEALGSALAARLRAAGAGEIIAALT
jgi:hydroxymethylbilane synthase